MHLGTRLDRRYRLDRLVGEGASAWVFAAQDTRLEREVAIKLLKPCDAGEGPEQRRFVEEGRTLARLVHPHIVLVHDAAQSEEGLCYLVMELSTGGTLESVLAKRGTLPLDEVLALLFPLIGALACAHDRGIIHRDIKPANIALQGACRAKLLDFGIAQRREEAGKSDLAIGTPSYMAPEQASGDALTPAVDVWAMGVVFFRCLSGTMPFDSSSSTGVLSKLVRGPAPRFAAVCKNLGPRVAVALDRALEPHLHRRYQDMRSFARAVVVACEQDGVPLPTHPEAIGLPDFEAWRSSADVERTSPLRAVRPRPACGMEPHADARLKSRGLAAVAVAACLAALLGVTRDVQGAGKEGAELAPPKPLRSAGAMSDPAQRAVSLSRSSAVPASRAPSVTLPQSLEGPSRVAAHRRKVDAVRARTQHPKLRATTPLGRAARDQSAAPPGIVTDWDWE
jgi:serine/threonine-protein kinase